MKKIKILVIAPYKGMAELIHSASQKRDDIDLTIEIGDMSTGVKIAKELSHNNYNAIISRGGTADMIRTSVELPVIEVSISVYDILRAIKMAQNYSGKFVIAGFPGITKPAHVLCDLLQYDIDIITFNNEADVEPSLQSAIDNGCTLALCDMISFTIAQKIGLNSILLTSGVESIDAALNEAVKLVTSLQYVKKQKDLFQSILTNGENNFLIYEPSGNLWFSSLPENTYDQEMKDYIDKYLDSFLHTPDQIVEQRVHSEIITLSNRHILYDDQIYTAITIQRKKDLFEPEDKSISIYNKSDRPPHNFFAYYGSANHVGSVNQMITQYSKTSFPVLILGETGTGKDKTAQILYEKGPYAHSPLYTIDCNLLNDRKWNSLLCNETSPLTGIHTTIYIKNLGALTKNQLSKLFLYLEQTDLQKRNRLLFSLVSNDESYAETKTALDYLTNHLSCLTLHLLPLRERKEDISSIATLYINKFNASLGKQIIGFNSDAIQLMKDFSWKHNLDQLQRVIKELVITTSNSYISSESVRQILRNESFFTLTNFGHYHIPIDLNKPLEEINYQIIQMILNEEKGNKERTAARLGIGRSTLWRILKNHSD